MAVISSTRIVHITKLFYTHKKSVVQNWKRMVTSKKFVLAKYFDGVPKESDLELIEEELPPLKDGGKFTYLSIGTKIKISTSFICIEFLAKAVYLSVDPYMRAYAYRMPLGSTMVGTQVAQ